MACARVAALSTVAAGLMLALPAAGQTVARGPDAIATVGCPRPKDNKEAKVLDFDPRTAVARLAVHLGGGRFTVAAIKIWERPGDPRPLVPVIQAARIMGGTLDFFSPDLTPNPESAPQRFLIRAEMRGDYVCWATPTSLIDENSYELARGERWAAPPAAEPMEAERFLRTRKRDKAAAPVAPALTN